MKRSQTLFFILGGFFITNALVAELIGGKIFSFPMPEVLQKFFSLFSWDVDSFKVSVGIIPWPIVFVATDLVNEFFGRRGVRFYTFTTIFLILYTFFLLHFARLVPAAPFSPVSQEVFDQVFGLSQGIIFGSIVAFGVSQLVDVFVFSIIRRNTGHRHLWARATGSTIVSQFIDTFIIGYIAFKIPGLLTWSEYIEVSSVSYVYKVFVAILITPLCYIGHHLIYKFLGNVEAERLIQEALVGNSIKT